MIWGLCPFSRNVLVLRVVGLVALDVALSAMCEGVVRVAELVFPAALVYIVLVFRSLFDDVATAVDVNRTFEAAYDTLLARHGVEPIPGAEDAILALRERGLKICLATGFGRHTQNMILESLGWMGLADLSLCPSDAGRGRPYPDIILTAVLAWRAIGRGGAGGPRGA